MLCGYVDKCLLKVILVLFYKHFSWSQFMSLKGITCGQCVDHLWMNF